MNKTFQKDSILILAWPQTPVSSVGMWYDAVPEFLGLLKDGYYKAGHAAAVLVNHRTKELKYFDFGRYHMPQKFGRVRDEQSDPLLKIPFKAEISEENNLLNINEILLFLNENKECHGKGILYASVLEDVNFNSAFKFAKDMQNADAVNYGPYDLKGSNCSRFIASLAKAGMPKLSIRLRLSLPILLTPLPKGNVISCNSKYYSVDEFDVEKHNVKFFDSFKNFVFPGSLFFLGNKSKKEILISEKKQFSVQNMKAHG